MNKGKYFEIKEKHKVGNTGDTISLKLVDSKNEDMLVNITSHGIVDIIIYINGSKHGNLVTKDDVQMLHIDNINDFMSRLQEIIDIAKENFSDEDFKNNWSNSTNDLMHSRQYLPVCCDKCKSKKVVNICTTDSIVMGDCIIEKKHVKCMDCHDTFNVQLNQYFNGNDICFVLESRK